MLQDVKTEIESAAEHQIGEFVVMLSVVNDSKADWTKVIPLLDLLLHEIIPRKARSIVASTFSVNKNALYDYALSQKSVT